jgi:curli production assembly/transport component CsgF
LKSFTTSCFFLVILLFNVCNIKTTAQQLVYTPINPSFGGSPLNGNWLLSYAQLQDLTTDPSAQTEDDPLAAFEDNLNRSILNQISRQITESLFGETGLTEGQFEFGDFQINITETLDGLNISIFDIITGNETTIFIPYP